MRKFIALALVAGSAGILMADDGPAPAPSLRATAEGSAWARIMPVLKLTELKPLNFGRILQGSVGDVTIDVHNGGLTHGAGVVMPPAANTSRGEWTINAQEYMDYIVGFSDASGGNIGFSKTISLDHVTIGHSMDLDASLVAMDADANGTPGSFKIFVGGTLKVPADAKAGTYKGKYYLTAFYM